MLIKAGKCVKELHFSSCFAIVAEWSFRTTGLALLVAQSGCMLRTICWLVDHTAECDLVVTRRCEIRWSCSASAGSGSCHCATWLGGCWVVLSRTRAAMTALKMQQQHWTFTRRIASTRWVGCRRAERVGEVLGLIPDMCK